VSNIVKTYTGQARDVETIIRLRDWMVDEIAKEMLERDIILKDHKLSWDYIQEDETFEFTIHAIS
jgi:hypothetical protein